MSEMAKKALKSAKEKVEVERRLRKKYPQMYKEGWGKKEKKGNWATRLKGKVKSAMNPKKSVRTSATERGLKKAGVADKKIKRMRGE